LDLVGANDTIGNCAIVEDEDLDRNCCSLQRTTFWILWKNHILLGIVNNENPVRSYCSL